MAIRAPDGANKKSVSLVITFFLLAFYALDLGSLWNCWCEEGNLNLSKHIFGDNTLSFFCHKYLHIITAAWIEVLVGLLQ